VRRSLAFPVTVPVVVAGLLFALVTPVVSASASGTAQENASAGDGLVAEPEVPDPQTLTATTAELKGERTETSRTFLQPDGSLRTVVFASPVNYETDAGGWRPIDNALVDSQRAGYAAENGANDYQLRVPDDAGSIPVRFGSKGEWVTYALAGLDG